MRRIYLLLFTLFTFLALNAQKQHVEIIWIIPSEGDSALVYYHVKTHFPGIERKIGPLPDHGIKYLCPDEVRIDSLNQSMSIEGGEFSLIEIKSKKDLITPSGDGLSLFKNSQPVQIEDDFDLASFMWVLPESATFHDFHSSMPGSFSRYGNTLLFTARQVNQLEFEILFKEQPEETQNENPEVASENQSKGPNKPIPTRQIPDTLFTATIHFESSKYQLYPQDESSLEQLVEKTKQHPRYSILVSGHTDTVPFKPGARSNNWELSARRASTIVTHLVRKGIPEARISASFHSHQKVRKREAKVYLLTDNQTEPHEKTKL
jgi:outer membrane protein OmpA-like peptidoglycan-associated protein